MLEHRVLLMHARTNPAMQFIVDADSGAVLGYARWERERDRSWRRLLRRRVLAVHEQEDEPLLFTVERAWSLLPRRDVWDAEGQPVGCLAGRFVHDRHGQLIAALDDGVFLDPFRRVLAELAPSAEGLRLTFRDEVAGEPFVKMLLLAAALQKTN